MIKYLVISKKGLKWYFPIIIALIIGCGYSKDKLRIRNDTGNDICYTTLFKDKRDNMFYQASAGGKVAAFSFDDPIIRQPISTLIEENSSDKVLYIIFHGCSERSYIYKNLNNIIYDKKYFVIKYSDKELDSINWFIIYKGDVPK